MKFVIRMVDLLDSFDLLKAEQLSREIHQAKAEDYKLSRREEKYWQELTDKIQECYKYDKR